MNKFIFNEAEHFIQKHGRAMGTKMAQLSLTSSLPAGFERKALEGFPHNPYIWRRYIDDIFIIWTLGEQKLDEFLLYFNNIHPSIKFTSERSISSIPFHDVRIQFNIKWSNRKRSLLSTHRQTSGQINRARQISKEVALEEHLQEQHETDSVPLVITSIQH